MDKDGGAEKWQYTLEAHILKIEDMVPGSSGANQC